MQKWIAKVYEHQSAWECNTSLLELLFVYQNLRILVMEHNKVYSTVLVTTKICFISFATFGAYGAFRTSGALAIFNFSAGIFTGCFLVLYMVLLGEVHQRSKDLLSLASKNAFIGSSRLRDDDESGLWLRKSLQSYREMRVEVGSAYFIDKPTVLTTFRILLECIINFILITA